ncbi:MAG: metallopeptidase TldD-related protein [Burkholderiaceae bacterium]
MNTLAQNKQLSGLTKVTEITESAFGELADAICTPSDKLHRTMLSVQAEASDFIRFNHNQVRQATRVNQYQATLSLVNEGRRISSTVSLGPDTKANITRLKQEHQALAKDLAHVPEDPHLLLPNEIRSTRRVDPPLAATSIADVIASIIDVAQGTDMVGFYAGGPAIVGFADSRGQRNWHQVHNFHFDWSLYLDVAGATDRAIKSTYAGQQWDITELGVRMDSARQQLGPLAQPARTIKPGKYRAYISPAATTELLGGLAWSGFSRKERNTGTSSLCRLADGSESMHPSVLMAEATGDGIAPGFNSTGFIRPDNVNLVKNGQAADCLVSPRSAAEFGDTANSDDNESPHSLSLAGGNLNANQILAELGTGIWISNLWYLNYSDRPNCRMTGMTRFASFWVQDGVLVAPITPMRFDDSAIRLFGSGLLGLTNQPEFMPDPSTWGARHLSSFTAPGMLVNDMNFTL